MLWFLSVLIPTLSYFSGCVTFLNSLKLINGSNVEGTVSDLSTNPNYFILLLIV